MNLACKWDDDDPDLSGLKSIVATALCCRRAAPLADEKRHATTLIGTPKYGPDFKHFDYVNPNAPKGGSVRLGAMGTFDSFNIITYKGNIAGAVGQIYDQLMATSLEEPSGRISPDRRMGLLSAGLLLRHLQAARRGALA